MSNPSQALVLLGLAAVLPACGAGNRDQATDGGPRDGGGIDAGGPSPVVLFSDDFSDACSAGRAICAYDGSSEGKWRALSGSVAANGEEGNPAPCLQVRATVYHPPYSFVGQVYPGVAQSTSPAFSTSAGLTVAADVSADLSSSSSNTSFAILDAGGAAIAALSFSPGNGYVSPLPPPVLTFSLAGATANVSPPSGFHRYVFAVTAAGQASWTMDGSVMLTASGIESADVTLEVRASGATAETMPTYLGRIYADNVAVTSP